MPPSPAVRISPAREVKAENHKRGRSLESGFLFREKDDDLALFNEVQNKEKQSFLLQTDDDFDDMFPTKLRDFSDYKLGVSIPARGESSDLLSAEGDKNDYDWLITPPETPLFPSLDDEAPQDSSLAPRGRPRSQPITISRSSTMEKGYRSGRGSASPHRLSPSPRSGTSTLQSRSRPFSATHSSPPPTLRHPSPSRRLSPPPSKPIPAPRSNTPTPRRLSTGSRVRGASPVNTTRGNSASPKIKAWQSNIPGFSLEAPPNLRTSLADRPASYVRGSSPASRNGSGSRRQSMSPTASRSVSSSISHERDQFSSHSRGSVASSGDDEVDSLQSFPISCSDRSAPKNIVASPNNRTMGFSKKPTKPLSNSAPKRSFDLALRQMVQEKKAPQNMFRPLLSSVPSSTFYAGKASTHHRALTSRNSSITTSSNASSDQGTSGALDTEENEQNHDDVTSGFVKVESATMHDEVFVIDHGDAITEPIDNTIIEENANLSRVSNQVETTLVMVSADVVLDGKYDYSDADGTLDMEACCGCSNTFPFTELIREGDLWFCLECKSLKINSMVAFPVETVKKEYEIEGKFVHDVECGLVEVLDKSVSNSESVSVTGGGETEMHHLDSTANVDHIVADQQPQQSDVCSTSEVDVSEGAGISLLLKASNSSKGRLVQSRSFTASNICYDDFSYVRDSVNSLRSCDGHSNASVSSSVDLGSCRQSEGRIHRQSSGKKFDIEKYEILMKHKRSVSSMSGASVHGSHGPSTTPSCLEQSLASDLESSTIFKADAELLINLMNFHSTEGILPSEEPILQDCGENLTIKISDSINEEIEAQLQTSTKEEDTMESSSADMMDVTEVPHLNGISEMEIQTAHVVDCDSLSDIDSTNSNTCANELPEPSTMVGLDGVVITTTEELNTSVPTNCVHEESTVLLEDHSGTKSRSLTLEEATDTILFCSSIVHNLAYKAANIAIEKENLSMEVLRPTLVGKPNSDRREMRSRPLAKRSSKYQKARQRRLDTETKPQTVITGNEEKHSPRIVRSPSSKENSMHPPKLESKCNCAIM